MCGLPLMPSLLRGGVAAVAGAIAEQFGTDAIDDNLTIPLAAWAAQYWFLPYE